MSADNEIATLQFAGGYAVKNASTSHLWTVPCDITTENATPEVCQTLVEAFGDGPFFTTEAEAESEDERLTNECDFVEYGSTFYKTDLPWARIVALAARRVR